MLCAQKLILMEELFLTDQLTVLGIYIIACLVKISTVRLIL